MTGTSLKDRNARLAAALEPVPHRRCRRLLAVISASGRMPDCVVNGMPASWICTLLVAGMATLIDWRTAPAAPGKSERVQTSGDSQPAAAIGRSIDELIRALDSRDYGEREQATQELAAAGEAAVEPLLKAAQTGSLEVAVRAVKILESVYTTGEEPAVTAAEVALEQLMQSTNRSAAARADSVLVRHGELREERAIAEIRKLGGIVKLNERARLNIGRGGGVINAPRAVRQQVNYIWLTPDWTGGDEGLKYIQRLRNSGAFAVFRIAGDHVTEKGIQALQAAMPDLVVQHRGRASLGIEADTQVLATGGCLIKNVAPNSAAAEGGIRQDDVLLKFNGEPIANFYDLVEKIKKHEPGDDVTVTALRGARVMPRGGRSILRGGQPVELEVKLKGWAPEEP